MSPLSESYTVQQWAGACGAAPVSGTLVPGGPATVRAEGSELVISAGRSTLRTDRCLDPLPTLSPDSHTTDGSSWRTRCSTPSADPRHAVVNAAYFMGADGAISLAETGRYEFTINNTRCIADVKRAASIHRVVASAPATASAQAPAPSPVVTATPVKPGAVANPYANPCSFPGDPARLEMRPSRKLLRMGDDFSFRAVVLDANGCYTGTPIQWTVASLRFQDGQTHGATPTVDASGKLSVPAADFTDATFEVVATAAGRSAKASVQATSAANFDALLAQSGLGPNGERDEPAVAILATQSIGATDVHAEDGARKRRTVFIAVIGGLTAMLAVVAYVGLRRARRGRQLAEAAEEQHAERLREFDDQKREREEKHAAQMRAHLESVKKAQEAAAAMAARGGAAGPVFCPSCRREFPGQTTFCPFDSNRLVAVAGHENLMIGPAGGICPTCKRGFNPGVKVCPHDGDELVPPAMISALAAQAGAPAHAPNPAPPRGKICPTCGGRFDGMAAFCGKDGTQLVLLN
jgi:rubrerythrin